jgi:hypothetical protein
MHSLVNFTQERAVTEQIHRDIIPPSPRPQPAWCRVDRAREHLWDELARLAGVELSTRPGTPPERHSDYWLGRLSGSALYLLWTLDEQGRAGRHG